ncbi:hypothetical protein SUGI_1171960 [Cryptomeria japonica]|nr:hypothetical protein SUGI_1171960 [Cryptomeria japonica]
MIGWPMSMEVQIGTQMHQFGITSKRVHRTGTSRTIGTFMLVIIMDEMLLQIVLERAFPITVLLAQMGLALVLFLPLAEKHGVGSYFVCDSVRMVFYNRLFASSNGFGSGTIFASGNEQSLKQGMRHKDGARSSLKHRESKKSGFGSPSICGGPQGMAKAFVRDQSGVKAFGSEKKW